MNIRQAYLEMIKRFPGGWDSISAALGMSRDGLENRIFERKGQGIRVDTALQIQSFSNTAFFAEAVAAVSGGVFIKLPDASDLDEEELQEKFHLLIVEYGELSAEYMKDIKDGEIDRKERERLKAIMDDMHRTITELGILMFRVYCKSEKAE